jgi:hypothetical protein
MRLARVGERGPMSESEIKRLAVNCPECHSPITVVYVPGVQFPDWAWDCPWWPKGCRWRGSFEIDGEVIGVEAGWAEQQLEP